MPMSNPILNSMVRRFVKRLKQQLQVMESSYQEQNYMDLMVIANWVKSEALNLGFEELRSPIASLELCLRRQEFEPIDDIIKKLQNMAGRIEISDEPVDDGSSLGVKAQRSVDPIPYMLPDSDKKAELLENFVSQLGLKLLEMQSAWQEGNADNLSKICNWILKYGTRLDVPEVIDSAERLDFSLQRNDVDRISQRLWDFIGVYSRIEIVAS
jgi:HPt (histidine-containing phosphotransfer) domain-containing protein